MAPRREESPSSRNFRAGMGSGQSLPDMLVDLWAALAVIGGPLLVLTWGAIVTRSRVDGDLVEVAGAFAAAGGVLAAAMLPALRLDLPGRRWMLLGVGLPVFGTIFAVSGAAALALWVRPAWAEPELAVLIEADDAEFWAGYLERHGGEPGTEGRAAQAVAALEDPARDARLLVEVARRDPRRQAELVVALWAASGGEGYRASCFRAAVEAAGFVAEDSAP